MSWVTSFSMSGFTSICSCPVDRHRIVTGSCWWCWCESVPPHGDRLGWRSGPGRAEGTTASSRQSGRREVCGGSRDPSRSWFGTRGQGVCPTLPLGQRPVGGYGPSGGHLPLAEWSETVGRGPGKDTFGPLDHSTTRPREPAETKVLVGRAGWSRSGRERGCRAAGTPLGARPLEAAKFGARGFCGPTKISLTGLPRPRSGVRPVRTRRLLDPCSASVIRPLPP
jgi:hypothetical protein